jgi:prepilin-type N-terminal cleavage/methylation domain-containing protein
MIKQIRHRSSAEQGFTIVELMIATTVLSTLLVVVAIVMISIGKLYYKGLNQARLQDNTRNAVTAIAKQLQLNTGDPATRSPAYDATGLAAGAPRDLPIRLMVSPTSTIFRPTVSVRCAIVSLRIGRLGQVSIRFPTCCGAIKHQVDHVDPSI